MAHKTAQLKPKTKFGEWLVDQQAISRQCLENTLDTQKRQGCKFMEALESSGEMSAEDIAAAFSRYLGIDYVALDDVSAINVEIARQIPESMADHYNIVAIGEKEDKIVLAMEDPLDLMAKDVVASRTERKIYPVVSSPMAIQKARDAVYHGSYIEEEHLRDLVETEGSREEEFATLESEYDDLAEANIDGQKEAVKAPVIRFVNLLLSQAVKSRASDIHIEPQRASMDVRMRVDGVLRNMVSPPRTMYSGVITRLKILSKMNIAERRLPQDGRFKIKAPGREIDMRVSVIPTIYGEKLVMRILDKASINHDFKVLGFEPHLLTKLESILHQPHGIIVVTGPTGSGKSTTLYSALNYLKDPKRNITTVEDPVEYRLDGINQIQVKPEIDLDFAVSLRAILRQDPDIILIGEIRDKETAEIAIKASLTGHLVLSTFHTNDAPSTLTRMAYMGIDRYLLASTLNLVIAQRLVGKICENCKEPVELDDQTCERIKIDRASIKNANFFRGKGCGLCGQTGYLGRLPIFEFLVMTPQIRKALVESKSEAQIRGMARADGYGNLLDSGVKKVLQGLTTAEEVIKTAFTENIS